VSAVPAPRDLHGKVTAAMSAVMVVIGIAILVTTLARGGGPLAVGVLLGVLFVAAGAGRLYLERLRRREDRA
jgi:hypothetical protein